MISVGKRWQLPAIAAVVSGPLMAAAEGSGAIDLPLKSVVVYVLAAGLTVISAMFTAILYFIKREHSTIVGGIAKNNAALESATQSIRDDVHKLRNTVGVMSLTLEQNAGEFRAELAKCVKVSENSASLGRVHEKINGLDRALEYVRAKMGLEERSTVRRPREDDTGDGEA